MKNIKAVFVLTAFSFFCLMASSLYSQDDLVVVTGKKYKLVLFDDTEITGKVTYSDSSIVKIQDSEGVVITVLKDNILYLSSNLTPGKYRFSLTLMGGLIFESEPNGYYYKNQKSGSIPHIDLSATYYMSRNKAIKVDIAYSSFNVDDLVETQYSGYPSYYSGGRVSYFYIKPNILFGAFVPDERITAYGSLGIGMHYTKLYDREETYYSTYDSTWRTYNYPANNTVNLVLSLGGGIGYRITDRIGINAELEYNSVTGRDGWFLFFGGKGYFPARVGFTYFFY